MSSLFNFIYNSALNKLANKKYGLFKERTSIFSVMPSCMHVYHRYFDEEVPGWSYSVNNNDVLNTIFRYHYADKYGLCIEFSTEAHEISSIYYHDKDQSLAVNTTFDDNHILNRNHYSRDVINKYFSWFKNGTLSKKQYYDKDYMLYSIELFNNGLLKQAHKTINGQMHGEYHEWYPSGVKKKYCKYHKNIKHGKYIEWYPSGVMRIITNYYNDAIDGDYYMWHLNGLIYRHGQYCRGKLHGVSTRYKYRPIDDESDQHTQYTQPTQKSQKSQSILTTQKSQHTQPTKITPSIKYNNKNDNIICYISQWKNNICTTKYKTINGKIDGKKYIYDSTGNVIEELNYVNDKLHGKHIIWSNNFTPKTLLNYIHGKLHGTQQYWDDNKQLHKLVEYANGEKHGEELTWDDNKKLSSFIKYEHGKLVN